MGRDCARRQTQCARKRFQFTRQHGARPARLRPSLADGEVSIHAPAWGATSVARLIAPLPASFQFTRQHGARLSAALIAGISSSVSIHAPAWGATTRRRLWRGFFLFQFTRQHGARPTRPTRGSQTHAFQFTRQHGARLSAPAKARPSTRRFNSRASMGRDRRWRLRGVDDAVSIHAPAWGATGSGILAGTEVSGFNSRASMGRDTTNPSLNNFERLFQFTRPHGARPALESSTSSWSLFQFTRPHGARQGAARRQARADQVSIHAPAWGATGVGIALPAPVKAFQFTRPHGARHEQFTRERREIEVSIHAPAWGATSASATPPAPSPFQFTRPHGARPDARRHLPHRARFNSRARMGRDLGHLKSIRLMMFQFTRPHGARRNCWE